MVDSQTERTARAICALTCWSDLTRMKLGTAYITVLGAW